MNAKLRIAEAENVCVTALLTLQQKGYLVRCERSGSRKTWIAENASAELIAEDTIALLGLAAIAELHGFHWMPSDEQIQGYVKEFGLDQPS